VPRLLQALVALQPYIAELQGDPNYSRKTTVPYGLYVGHGFVSSQLARQTGFSAEALFWQALKQMFEDDRSAARGLMALRKLIVFKHAGALGNAPAHQLFELLSIRHKDASKPARAYVDYEITLGTPPAGVEAVDLTMV
jgi:CRISPR-associated protein Csd2